MADTVAVMNAGVIEQMGAPAELYENPRSTFVANFLGQSNLIEGTVKSRAADVVTVDMHGIDVSIPADRAHAPGDRGWIGIRPEKVLIGDVGEELDAPGNTIPGGVVSDVSFVGVSTQYLVRMPWGQELQVFSQNTGRTRIFARRRQGRALLATGVRVPPRRRPGRLRRRPAGGRGWLAPPAPRRWPTSTRRRRRAARGAGPATCSCSRRRSGWGSSSSSRSTRWSRPACSTRAARTPRATR